MISRIKKFLIKEKKLNKLKEIYKELERLESKNHIKGRDILLEKQTIVQRWISRVYPEKDRKDFKIYPKYLVFPESYQEKEEAYLNELKILKRVITTIIEEFKTFSFHNFKLIKEKVELSGQLGYGSNKLKAKKIIEKEK